MKSRIEKAADSSGNIVSLIKETLQDWTPEPVAWETGTVLTVGDGIAVIDGLEHAVYGEILLFPSGIKGMVQDLSKNKAGCILFGDEEEIREGDLVKRTGKLAGIPVGDEFTGRVIDALGMPIDGKGKIESEGYHPIENPAPGIIERKPVNKPLETELLAIDSMFPIGRGQRELIIGDRQTGKTAIALDTILNQKGKNVICIYVAIGQKASSVAQLVENLRKRDAMEYTIVVNASASEPAPLQYIAPYSGWGGMDAEAKSTRLLPFHRKQFASSSKEKEVSVPFEFFPSIQTVLDNIMHSYISGFIYSALIDSFCSEQTARMTAMNSANQNAQKILDELSVQYHLVRQAAITQEIMEVSSGAKAQKKKKLKEVT